MQLPPNKKVFFLSDFHLGAPNHKESIAREKQIAKFFDEIKDEASTIFIVGDLFDFWYEYKQVVPKGFVRILGKLAELTDSGITVHFFVGNHDMWMKKYFQEELNIPVYFEPKTFDFNGKRFLIGHGDGLGPGDRGYKMLKKIFRSPLCQFLFGLLPPVAGIGIAKYFSQKSRDAENGSVEIFRGEENEWLITYSKQTLAQQHYDFFVFGHRHLPIDFRLQSNGKTARYINLGEWINYATYAVFDGEQLTLQSYSGQEEKIYRNW